MHINLFLQADKIHFHCTSVFRLSLPVHTATTTHTHHNTRARPPRNSRLCVGIIAATTQILLFSYCCCSLFSLATRQLRVSPQWYATWLRVFMKWTTTNNNKNYEQNKTENRLTVGVAMCTILVWSGCSRGK